jgi:hypothetical protein
MNSAKVVELPASTSFKPEQALHSALQLDLTDVLTIGYDADGVLAVRSSQMTRADALFLVEQAREWVMRGGL